MAKKIASKQPVKRNTTEVNSTFDAIISASVSGILPQKSEPTKLATTPKKKGKPKK